MVYFKDNYNFPKLKGGSNIFQGGGRGAGKAEINFSRCTIANSYRNL